MRLSYKILLVALLNVVLLIVGFGVAIRFLFREELSSFLLAPARDRLLSIGRLIALELSESNAQQRNDLLARYSRAHGARFLLYENGGSQVAGPEVDLPSVVRLRLAEAPRPGGHPPPGLRPAPLRTGLFVEREDGYWIGIRIPVPSQGGGEPIRGTLIIATPSLFSNDLLLDYRPLLAVVGAVIAICVACWLPLIRGITHSISLLTRATEQIAEGRFDVNVDAARGDELGQLGGAINRMSGKLAGFVTGQKRFLGDIAHELCSPIARVQMAIGILEERAGDRSRPYVEDLREDIQHMSGLVNELLSFSKAGMRQEAVALEAVNVHDIVHRAVERESVGQIRIEIDTALQVRACPEFLLRSLSNLVRNAVRYAGAAGPIVIGAARQSNQIAITVSDCGPGVDDHELENIFSPFYRPELARQRETGGAGLGLAIVKSCIEACEGSVSARNRRPAGFEVTLRLTAV